MSYLPTRNGYYDSVAEIRHFQRNPHKKTIDGSYAIPDVDPSELEFYPQDKKGTLDYRHLTEQDKPEPL